MNQPPNPNPKRVSILTVFAACLVGVLGTLVLIPLGSSYWPLTVWIIVIGLTTLFRKWALFAATIVVGLITLLMIPAVAGRGEPSASVGCMNNLRQLALAINNYESHRGHYPPPFTTDKDGNRLHSWRVLILPYMEERELFNQIDLNKPWNHPDNLRFASAMPSSFACWSVSRDSPTFTTSFVAVTGVGTMWPTDTKLTLQEIPKGVANTALLIESEAARTHWMAPYDLAIDQIVPVAKNGQTNLLSGNHPGFSHVAFADCHVERI